MNSSWKVVYWGEHGREHLSVRAGSRAVAAATAAMMTSRVISIRREWINLHYLRLYLLRPDEKDQLNLLLNIQANCLTGNFDKIKDLIGNDERLAGLLRLNPSLVRDDLELSRRLRGLQFNLEVCAAIESGEHVGDLSSGMNEAIRYLRRMMELRGKTMHQFVLGLIMLLAGFGIIFFFLPTLSDTIRPLVSAEGINFSKTIATDLLLLLSGFIGAHRIWIILALLLLIVCGVFCYRYIRCIFPFSLFDELQKTRRSIKFLAGWILYRVSGMALETDNSSLCRMLGEEVGTVIFQDLERGASLSEVITTRHFSPILVGAMPALCRFQEEHLKEVSDLLLANLVAEQQQQSKAIAGFFYALSITVSLLIVILLAYGLIFPIFGSVAGFQL